MKEQDKWFPDGASESPAEAFEQIVEWARHRASGYTLEWLDPAAATVRRRLTPWRKRWNYKTAEEGGRA